MHSPALGLLLVSFVGLACSSAGPARNRGLLPRPPLTPVETSTIGFDVPADRETEGAWFGIAPIGPVRGYRKEAGERLGPGAARFAMTHDDGSRWDVECRARLDGDGHVLGCLGQRVDFRATASADRLLLVLLAKGSEPIRGLFADREAIVPLTGFRGNVPVDTHLILGSGEGFGYLSRGPGDPDAARFRRGTPKRWIDAAVPMALMLGGVFDPRWEARLPERGFDGAGFPSEPPGDLSSVLGSDPELEEAVGWVLAAVSAPAERQPSPTASRWTRHLRLAAARGTTRFMGGILVWTRSGFGGAASPDARILPSALAPFAGFRLRLESPHDWGGLIGFDVHTHDVDANEIFRRPDLGFPSFGLLGGASAGLLALEPFVLRGTMGGRFDQRSTLDGGSGQKLDLYSAGIFLGLDLVFWPSTAQRSLAWTPRLGLQLAANRRLGRSASLPRTPISESGVATLDRLQDGGRLPEWWFELAVTLSAEWAVIPKRDFRAALIDREPGHASPSVGR